MGGQKAVLSQCIASSLFWGYSRPFGVTRGHCADLSGFTPESILIRSSQGQAPTQSWGRMSGSARHPLAGRPVEGYICPIKQEAPMNAAPWTSGYDPCPGRCALPGRQALEGAVGLRRQDSWLPPPLLPHVLFQLGLRHSELSESHPCSWPTVTIVRSGVGKPEPVGQIWFTACSYMAFELKVGFYIF